MYKNFNSEIKKVHLEPSFYTQHKEGLSAADFGMDNSNELVGDGLALYSSANLKGSIGPVKTEYFRIALIRQGSVTLQIGLEKFHLIRNCIVFGFPGQVFSMNDKTADFFCYYLLFKEAFILDAPLFRDYWKRYPFFTYSGLQCFDLGEDEANKVEHFILQVNDEIMQRQPTMTESIQLYIQLMLVHAKRVYDKSGRGEFFGVAATNKSVVMDVIDIIRLCDGKFVDHWGVLDMQNIMTQITQQ